MATPRRQSSLKPHLNQIREWVAEGATDLWIGHQLETTPSAVARFRRQQGILRDRAGRKPPVAGVGEAPAGTDEPGVAEPTAPTATEAPSDAAPVETSPAEAAGDEDAGPPPADKPTPRPRKRRGRKGDEESEAAAAVAGAAVAESVDAPAAEAFATETVATETDAAETATADEQSTRDGEGDGEEPRSRRRGRRGGRGRRRENGEGEESADRGPDNAPERVAADGRAPAAEGAARAADTVELEGVFDQGTDGYGLWLDAAIREADVYRSHWKGKRELVVTVTADQIVLRRA